ncbi:MAG: DUF1566 domain-containing protein [Magnetococcales bacterium]|nr:DUF1566 domain-containing protein [Magnetococcales bacterium]
MDKLTGLMWLKNANCWGSMQWSAALTKIVAFNTTRSTNNCSSNTYTGSYTDWRLPSRLELESLLDLGNTSVPVQSGHPFVSLQADKYWTSTPLASDTTKAWYVDFTDGVVSSNRKAPPGQGQSTVSNLYVWPVRGGQ